MFSFLIAAATSNSGKTTFTMGLLRALRNKGMKVQPYKCGPDYIDTMFHHLASGNESINLDTFMASGEHVKSLFQSSANCDAQVVEGVMGLFDGYNKSKGSSAEIAMLLDIPVILVVNAKSTAYSVAPIIYGFKHFNPQVRLAGVVFNMVASESHYAFLRDACVDAGVACLGYIAKNQELIIPGRHLGLTISAREEMEQLINLAAEEVEKHVDIDLLIEITNNIHRTKDQYSPSVNTPNIRRKFSISIAKDSAFNFIYKANIDALRSLGEVTFFSPLTDKEFPTCDLLYLPGGYPELFAAELSANTSMLQSIHQFAEQGGHIYAECGGFMYLCKSIDSYPMCGVLPLRATMQNAHLHLGYRTMLWNGKQIHGHEFHYSDIIPQDADPNILIERLQSSAKGTPVTTSLYRYRNVLAGYTHWYWAETGFPFFDTNVK